MRSPAHLIFSLTLILGFGGCGGETPPGSALRDSDGGDRSATFGIAIDTGGNVEVEVPGRRELRMDLRAGSTSGSSSARDREKSAWSSERERVVGGNGDSDGPESNCFVFEVARDRFGDASGQPSIHGVTQVEIANERYATRRAAEAAFQSQLSAVKGRMSAVWQRHQESIATMKGAVKVAATTHNAQVLRTLALTDDAVRAAGHYAAEFRTSPLTSAGARLQGAAHSLAHAWQVLPTKFSGADLAARSKNLKLAGNALKVADALFAAGEVDSGHYLVTVALTLIDVATSVIPGVGWAKDIVEAATGYGLFLGRDLTPTERAFALAGAVTGGIGSKFIVVQKALKAWDKLFVASGAGQEAMVALARAAQMVGG